MKPDADLIRQFLENLEKQDWVRRSERRWWPRFLFHYTDVNNAVGVLEDGCLYSREYLENTDKLIVSSGSSIVLAGTNTTVKDCVRLYFRPKTPTQYHAEGVRSKLVLSESMFSDACCPVPVFFLFDSSEILTKSSSFFSDGGLASQKATILSTADELANLPWKKIYHTGWFDTQHKTDIIFRRSAEVVVPQELDLGALRYIYCRSEAERETLLYLLPEFLRERYQNKVVSTTRSTLFFRQHTFLEKVRLSPKEINLNFSPDTHSLGPFELRINVQFNNIEKNFVDSEFTLTKGYNWKIPLNDFYPDYIARIFLDDHLIYANSYIHQEIEIPF